MRAPEPLGFNESGREMVSYLEGDVADGVLSGRLASSEALKTAAALLRDYHEATLGFDKAGVGLHGWMLPSRQPCEVICHGDFAPYNLVFDGCQAVGIIDFDAAHPGPRSWDLAYALYRWSPFMHPSNPEGFGDLDRQIERAVLFCEAYGASLEQRRGLADMMIERLRALVDFMQAQARDGNAAFAANIADGHHLLYLQDVKYLEAHREVINRALVSA